MTRPLVTVSTLTVLKNSNRILKNPLPFHNENFEKHGHTFMVNIGLGGSKVVFTRDAETVKHILQKNHKNYNKSALQTKDLAKYIGQGLLTSNGDFWRVHRRMVQPAFHKKKLEGLLGVMHTSIIGELNSILAGVAQDIFPVMGNLAFQVVAQSLFSAENLREKMGVLQHITTINQQMLIKEMRQPYLQWWFCLKGDIKKHLNLAEQSRELLDGIIQERINSNKEKDDLLDMLLKARYEDGTSMPRRQLIDEVLILFTAGHETTANTLSFTLFLLAKHPEIQEKVFNEVGKVHFSEENSIAILGQLVYTKQCIEESMRLYPPVYIIDRVSLDKDTIQGNNFEKGTVWLMSLYELHRDKDFWEEPDSFIPERFNTANEKEYADYFFPFGAGPRMCVGNNFAMYEMIMVIAEIIKKFKITTSRQEVAIQPLISLKPKDVSLVFTNRAL